MNKRLKSRLMYQIGLTDDPWDENEDKISDNCYSEDSHDPHDFIKFRRAKSADKHDLPKILYGAPYLPKSKVTPIVTKVKEIANNRGSTLASL
jgi:hypothetical protein